MFNFRFKIFSIALSAVVGALSLFAGCTESASRSWVQRTIEEHYYIHGGDYSEIENLSGLTISQMVKKLDIYSAYYTAKEYEAVKSDNAGNKSGIGISYSYAAGRGAVVSKVVGNSPAKKKGIKPGDVISGGISDGKTHKFNSSADFTSFMEKFDTDENFTLVLEDGREIEIAKADYTASYAAMYTRDKAFDVMYEGTGSKTTYEIAESGSDFDFLPDKTAYMTLSQFYGYADQEIGWLFRKFNAEQCDTLILDLRSNGGGYVNTMSQIAWRFLADYGGEHISMIARYKDGSEKIDYAYAEDKKDKSKESILPAGTRVLVMADSGTASASEALIGVLVSHGLVDYGNVYLSAYEDKEVKTYGKGIMQSTYTYITGEALKLTVAGIFWPDGKTSIHGVGLTESDGCTAVPATGGAYPGDEEVQYIAELIK